MRRFAFLLIFVAIALIFSGCSICATPDDEAYPAYGGIVERNDPYRGRVGSAFDSGVATVSHLEDFAEEYAGEPTEVWGGEVTGEAIDSPPAEEIAPPAREGDAESEPLEGDEAGPETPSAPEVYYE